MDLPADEFVQLCGLVLLAQRRNHLHLPQLIWNAVTVLLSKTEQGLSWDEPPLVSLKALDLDPLVAENRKFLSKINYMIKRNGLNEFPLHISMCFINGKRLYIDMAEIHITVSILFANGQLIVCRRKRYILL